MGLDIALGVIVLLAAMRGWFRGFGLQFVQIVAVASCVFLAGPLRDVARPIVQEYAPSIRADLLEKLLWWAGALGSYVAINLMGGSLIRLMKRKPSNPYEMDGPSYRGDQSAGALLGAAKGALLVAFLLAGVERYSPKYLDEGGWMSVQVKTSKALGLSSQYQPARKLWEAAPVQLYIQHVKRMGLEGEPTASGSDATTVGPPEAGAAVEPPRETAAGSRSDDPVRTAQRALKDLRIPPPAPSPYDPARPDFDLDRAVRQLEAEVTGRR